MIRSLKALALAAVGAAGILTATVAPASAANLTVYFQVLNNDSTNNMGIVSISSTIAGLGAGPIAPGAYDPPSPAHATWSDALPTVGNRKTATFTAEGYSAGTSQCTFTLTMSKDTNPQPYLLHFSSDASRCTVPADQRSSDGQFTSSVSVLAWQS